MDKVEIRLPIGPKKRNGSNMQKVQKKSDKIEPEFQIIVGSNSMIHFTNGITTIKTYREGCQLALLLQIQI